MRRLISIAMIAGLAVGVAACGDGHDHADHTHGAGSDGEAAYLNDRCPLMDEPITGTMPENLTRDFRGQTVAFCCDSCTVAWDGMNAAERAEKLKPVLREGVELPATP